MTTGIVIALLLVGWPVPGASAAPTLPPLGMAVDDIAPLKAAGAAPRYASYWVGEWMMSSGWGHFDKAMLAAKAAGATPVVYWYYWGDSISPNCVRYGCDGRTRAEWTTMTSQLASHIRSTMGGAEVLVVLENEFNKNGITGSYAPTFDAYLADVAKTLRGVGGVKIVLGFGGWGEASWGSFPKSLAQSDYVGFQAMRASTRDTEASYRAAADRSAYFTNHIAQKFQKPSFLYDLALSSYPDATWARIQAETLDAIFSKLVASGSTGLQGVVYRSLDDHYMDPKNYFGHAESHWGLRTSAGVAKPAFSVWLKHAAPPAPFTATFGGVSGNAWWVQASVSGSKTLADVCARVNDGACQPMTLRSWGAWAGSFPVPDGSKVELRATATTGESVRSAAYLWPSATPYPTATFAPEGGNEWWVQTRVESPAGVASVCARVDAGACQPLALRSWGAWAASLHAPAGARVTFEATFHGGGGATSSAYVWPVK